MGGFEHWRLVNKLSVVKGIRTLNTLIMASVGLTFILASKRRVQGRGRGEGSFVRVEVMVSE